MQRRNWTICTRLEGTKLLMQRELTPGNEAQVWDHTPEDWPANYRRFLHSRCGLLSSLYYREKCAQGSPLFWLLISVRLVYPNRFSLILSFFDNGPVTVEVTLGFAKSSLLITTYWLGFWVKPIPAFVCAILLCGWSHCLLGGLKSILTLTQITESTDRKTWYSSLPLVVCSVIKNVYCIVSYVRHFNYDWKKWFHDNTIAATLGHFVSNYSALHSHIKENLCLYSCQRCHARHPFSCKNEKSRTLPKNLQQWESESWFSCMKLILRYAWFHPSTSCPLFAVSSLRTRLSNFLVYFGARPVCGYNKAKIGLLTTFESTF